MKTTLHLFAGLALAFTISLLNPTDSMAQTQGTAQNDIYTYVEKMPEYEGGEKAMLQYLGQNIRYRKDQPEGLVIVSFVVNPDKSVSDIAIVKGIDTELDKECMRVVETMSGQWTPGRQKGKDVRVRFVAPIRFAQDKTEPEPAANQPAPAADTMPEHKEGIVGMLNFINQNLTYNRAKSPEGLSVLSFIVHEDGTFSDYQVVRSLSPELDAEALRVTKLMSGEWKPGTQRGNPVKVKYTLPIRFK